MSANESINASIDQRNATKAAHTLLGICCGISADGSINDSEILFLRTWLREHEQVAAKWPGSMIAKRIDAILELSLIHI